jgi:hypothetical protein
MERRFSTSARKTRSGLFQPTAVAGELRFGVPRPLFIVRPPTNLVPFLSPLEVSRDGSRIYFAQGVEQPDADLIHIKIGWRNTGTQ